MLPPRASMAAWQRRLMLLTSLLNLLWGSSFHSSTTATRSSGRSRGCRARAWRRLLSWSQPCSSGLSSYDISTVWGRVVIHKDEIWCVLTMLWNNNCIYDIPEVGSASHSPIYDNQISFSLGWHPSPYCYTTPSISMISVSGNHIDRGISLTSTPPAALTAIISVKGDPGFISELLYIPGHVVACPLQTKTTVSIR